MKYKPLEGLVRVGSGYKPEFQGLCFCWESVKNRTHYNTSNITEIISSLRRLRVEPYQIDNIGTYQPFVTNSLPESKLEVLMHGLSKPLVIITKKSQNKQSRPSKTKKNFHIEIGTMLYQCSLKEIPKVLNLFQCKIEDLIFLQEVGSKYTSLDEKIKYEILVSLD